MDRQQMEKFYIDNKLEQYNGMYVTDVHNYGDSYVQVDFYDDVLADMAEDNDISWEDYPGYLPIASVHEDSQFFVVDTSKPGNPVLVWEHENGQFYPQSDSLNEFLKSLVKEIPNE